MRGSKNRWSSKSWKFRYAAYLGGFLTALFGFYGVENFRAGQAWDRHIHADGNHVNQRDRFEQAPAVHPTFESSAFLADAIKQASAGNTTIDLASLPDFVEDPGTCINRSGKVLQSELYFENCFPTLSPKLSRKAAAARFLELSEQWSPQIDKFNEAAVLPPGPALMPASDSMADFLTMLGKSPSVTEIKYTADLIRYRAHAHLITGDPDTALSSAVSSYKLANNIAHRATLIESTLAIAITAPCRGLIWEALNRRAWNQSQLQSLAHAIEIVQPAKMAQRSLFAERHRLIPLLEQFDSNPLQQYRHNRGNGFLNVVACRTMGKMPTALKEIPEMVDSAILALMPRGWARQNCLYACQAFDNQIHILSESNPDLRAKLKAFADDHSSRPSSPYTFLCQILLSETTAYSEGAWKRETRIRILRLAVASEIHYLKTGNYPNQLEDLSDQFTNGIPLDPCSGEPFRLRIENARPLIYSIGPNQSDDGGTDGTSPKGDDIIWHYPSTPDAP